MSVTQSIKRPLVVLTGPTAVGKTKLSIALAKAIGGEILSVDSMQVYKHMDIGSAKIRPEEMQGVPHHLIDILEPWEEFNVVVFQKRCLESMEQIYDRGHIPILVGGTGFYIQAVLRGIDFTENEENTEYREKMEQLAKEKGPEVLHDMLRKIDPVSAENIHTNNIKRTIRALEYYELTGEPISAHNEREKERTSPYNFSYFVLTDDRENLYARIETRETVLGYIQRGGSPTPYDRNLATRMGGHATELIASGQFGRMVSLQGAEIGSISLNEVAGKLKLVNENHDLIVQGKRMGICFG